MNNWWLFLKKGWCFIPAFFLLLYLSSCLTSTLVVPGTGYVTRVIDGDTIVLSNGEYVRYIGIDTPEMNPEEPFAREATQANRDLVEHKTVRLEKDTSETDRYGRLLRYVYVDDKFVNLELVHLGLAEAKAYPPDTNHQLVLDAAEVEARLAGRGMWAK
jgi:micrococcal nuclease